MRNILCAGIIFFAGWEQVYAADWSLMWLLSRSQTQAPIAVIGKTLYQGLESCRREAVIRAHDTHVPYYCIPHNIEDQRQDYMPYLPEEG